MSDHKTLDTLIQETVAYADSDLREIADQAARRASSQHPNGKRGNGAHFFNLLLAWRVLGARADFYEAFDVFCGYMLETKAEYGVPDDGALNVLWFGLVAMAKRKHGGDCFRDFLSCFDGLYDKRLTRNIMLLASGECE